MIHFLTLNAGSSSLKFALYRESDGRLTEMIRGAVLGIGTAQGQVTLQKADGETHQPISQVLDHLQAFEQVASEIVEGRDVALKAIGHRIVHGGNRFAGPVLIDEMVLSELRRLVPFAPLHQPVQVRLIEAACVRFPSTSQVGCFDTSIHHALPALAARFPLPKRLWDEGVRRYGFHGLSYEYVLDACPELREGKTIIAHLGNGASITAFHEGVSVETTMGFTPTGGLMMGTRCGDLDPGVVLYLLRQHHLTADELDRLVNQESGLKGVSGVTSDVRTLLKTETDDAHLALDMFCYQAAKQIGGLASVLNGVDQLVFTGAIGEHSAEIRASICERLTYLGLTIDPVRNQNHDRVVSRPASRCEVHVVPTNEERIIAKQTHDVLTSAEP